MIKLFSQWHSVSEVLPRTDVDPLGHAPHRKSVSLLLWMLPTMWTIFVLLKNSSIVKRPAMRPVKYVFVLSLLFPTSVVLKL